MQWMNDFTIALIEEDAHRIGALMDTVPAFEDIALAKEALTLIQNALIMVEKQKSETFQTIQKIKQTKAFLLSNAATKHNFIG